MHIYMYVLFGMFLKYTLTIGASEKAIAWKGTWDAEHFRDPPGSELIRTPP